MTALYKEHHGNQEIGLHRLHKRQHWQNGQTLGLEMRERENALLLFYPVLMNSSNHPLHFQNAYMMGTVDPPKHLPVMVGQD